MTLLANTAEVTDLVLIHEFLTGDKPGRRRRVEVLNKSGIVLLVACWEAFVEDLAGNAFDALLAGATAPTVFPQSVLTLAAAALRDDKDPRALWRLAGPGWRTVLSDHRAAVIDRYIGRLNTPRPKQVDEMFEKLLGIKGLSKVWYWKGATVDANEKRLDALVTLRGEIAHRVAAKKSVRKRDVVLAAAFIQSLAARSSNAVGVFVKARVGHLPWALVRYGGVV